MSHEAGPKSASGFIGLGFVCASTGIVASCFLLAALQAAYSPFAMQLPAAPFEQLETEAFRLAFAAFMTFALWHRLVGDAEGRGLSWLFGTGAIAKLGVLAFAASQGMSAIQMTDPRTLPPKLFTVRAIANAMLVASYLWLSWHALRHHRSLRARLPEGSPEASS